MISVGILEKAFSKFSVMVMSHKPAWLDYGKEAINFNLEAMKFTGKVLKATDKSVGFVNPVSAEPEGQLLYEYKGLYFFCIKVKELHYDVLKMKQVVAERLETLEQEQQREPTAADREEIQEKVAGEFRETARESVRLQFLIVDSIHYLLFSSGSSSESPLAVSLFGKAMDFHGYHGFNLHRFDGRTNYSMSQQLTRWLAENRLPECLTFMEELDMFHGVKGEAPARFTMRKGDIYSMATLFEPFVDKHMEGDEIHYILNDSTVEVTKVRLSWLRVVTFTLDENFRFSSVELDLGDGWADTDEYTTSLYILLGQTFSKLVMWLAHEFGKHEGHWLYHGDDGAPNHYWDPLLAFINPGDDEEELQRRFYIGSDRAAALLRVSQDPEAIPTNLPAKLADIMPGWEDNPQDSPEAIDTSKSFDSTADDELYPDALDFVKQSNRASITAVQRKLRIGYNRAARLVEMMEREGVVSTPGKNGARTVIA